MSVILAIDPGSKSCGYAVVEQVGARVRYVSHGAFESTEAAAAELLADIATRSQRETLFAGRQTMVVDLLVGIERPSGFVHDPFRGPTLLATAWIGGVVAALAWSRGLDVIELSASQGRKLVIGKVRVGGRAKAGATDRAVKDALPMFVDGLPKTTNVHVRDALLVAVATNWLVESRRRAAGRRSA